MLSDCDLLILRKELVRQFGEDTAQYALLKLCKAWANGVEVIEPLAWCRLVSRRKEIRQSKRGKLAPTVSLEPFMAYESSGVSMAEAFLDTRDPESIYAAKEILDSLPNVLIEDAIAGESDGNYVQKHRERKAIKQRI